MNSQNTIADSNTKIVGRFYRDIEDYIKLRAFLEDGISISKPFFYFGLGDLDFNVVINSPENCKDNINEVFKKAFLWFQGDELLGGIWPGGKTVDIFLHPYKKDLFAKMVEQGEKFVKSYMIDEKIEEIEWWVFNGDTELEKVLIEKGYYRTNLYRPHRVFDYSTEILDQQLPEGYTIRKFSEVSDKSTMVELYKEYFNISVFEYTLNNFSQTSTYREDLDLAIIAPEGTIACFCTLRYDEKNKIGTFEPVACHPEHKQKGLSKALMLEALKRAKTSGTEMVTVQTSDPNRNISANKLYESVGFKKAGDLYFWRKRLI